MTNYLLAALFGALATTGYAQSLAPAGTVQLGGGFSYYQRHDETVDLSNNASANDSYSFGVSPAVGVFVKPTWVVGLAAGYVTDKLTGTTSGPSQYTRTERRYAVGPFAQRYLLLTEKFGLTGTAYIWYTRTTSAQLGFSSAGRFSGDGSSNGVAVALVPGLFYLPVSQLAVGASIGSLAYGYSSGSFSFSDGSGGSGNHNDFGAYFGFNYLAFNATYYFRRD